MHVFFIGADCLAQFIAQNARFLGESVNGWIFDHSVLSFVFPVNGSKRDFLKHASVVRENDDAPGQSFRMIADKGPRVFDVRVFADFSGFRDVQFDFHCVSIFGFPVNAALAMEGWRKAKLGNAVTDSKPASSGIDAPKQ